jgi:hypothetical protein
MEIVVKVCTYLFTKQTPLELQKKSMFGGNEIETIK